MNTPASTPLSLAPGALDGLARFALNVGARLVPAALGTDTGASVRLPAAVNGAVGFRPSVGRYDGAGITPIVCVGETLAQRFSGQAGGRHGRQVRVDPQHGHRLGPEVGDPGQRSGHAGSTSGRHNGEAATSLTLAAASELMTRWIIRRPELLPARRAG